MLHSTKATLHKLTRDLKDISYIGTSLSCGKNRLLSRPPPHEGTLSVMHVVEAAG